jgi:excinuclease ABC subunit A
MSKSSAPSAIRLRGARHNNLKNFDLDLPIGRLIVVTGPSGSGKSSLAFDTLYAEGQRRYIETFSPYARQFFDRMDKPQVDSIQGIPPAIAIEQRNTVKTTRSTVGTMTEICDYMKVVWPHLAQLHCRECGRPVRKDTPQQIWEGQKTSPDGKHSSSEEGRRDPEYSFLSPRGTSGERTEERGIAQLAPVAAEPDAVLNEAINTVPPPSASEALDALIAFQLPLSDKISLAESLALIAKQGYQRLLLDHSAYGVGEGGRELEVLRIDEAAERWQEAAPKVVTIVQDRLKLTPSNRARFVEACEQAYHFGKGRLTVYRGASATRYSNRLHCAPCDLDYREPTSALFSFNHPLGACPTCRGFGRTITIDYDLAIPDRSLSLAGGAVKPWQTGQSAESQDDLMKFCRRRRVPTDVPFADLSPRWQDWVLNGDPDYGKDPKHEWPHAWYGVKGYFRWLESKAYKMHVRVLLSRYRAYQTCQDCGGRRLQPEALQFKVPAANGQLFTLADFYQMPVSETLAFMKAFAARLHRGKTSDPLRLALEEVCSRLGYLDEVGLGYLSLDRATRTLSGGETERVSLTTCLGSRLVNTLFVLDEPSVGLHPRDTSRLVLILQRLRDAGNTVVVVEHEASVMRAADQIVDLGPGHGEAGGSLVFQGAFAEILGSVESLTGQYLSGKRRIEIPPRRNVSSSSHKLTLAGVHRHNLKDLTVEIPLARFVCISGVSGSGKTTLLREVLLPALEAKLRGRKLEDGQPLAEIGDPKPDAEEGAENSSSSSSGLRLPTSILTGVERLGRVVLVDQSPLGKTPRSNPAVYIGAFDHIRELFAQSDLARQRGLNASAFSFNSAQGQCELCRGAGFEKIEMQFLSDIYIRCPDCQGRRYRPHILEVKLAAQPPLPELALSVEEKTKSGEPEEIPPAAAPKLEKNKRKTGSRTLGLTPSSLISWSIGDLLDSTVDEVIRFLATFTDSRAAQRAGQSLQFLQEVGLGYLRLGQPINTLSGGESQRLKLVGHLAEFAAAETLGQKPTLFLFDEPTTGLHFDDVRILLQVFQRLVEGGHSVVVIEHNLDVIKSADWLIDLGPDAGDQGGRIVVQGTPETVATCSASHTGQALREIGICNAGTKP